MWHWTWTQWSNLFTRQSTLWWCTTKQSLEAKGSEVQKIQQKQSYLDSMSPNCDSDLEDSNPFLLLLLLITYHPSLWICITIPNLVMKGSAVQKISFKQTSTEIMNVWCDSDLEQSNPIFSLDILVNDIYHHTKFCCKGIISSEDIV